MERTRSNRAHSAPTHESEFGVPEGDARLEESVGGAEPSFDPAAAEEIWRMAARLQAEAASRLDDRSRAIATASDSEFQRDGFSLSEVKMIGDEAGIDPQFIELALRQQAAEKHAYKSISGQKSDLAGRFLGTSEDHVTVTRVIGAEKSKILAAMERLFPGEPFNLQLLEVLGENDDLADSTLIFKVPQVEQAVSASGINTFAYRMSIADLNRMTVSLHALDEKRTEVSVQLDLKYGKWRNFKMGSGISGVFGALFGFLAFAIGLKKLALGLGGVMGIAGITALILGYGAYWAYRLAYRSGLKKGRREIEDLLALLDVNARTGGSFNLKAGE